MFLDMLNLRCNWDIQVKICNRQSVIRDWRDTRVGYGDLGITSLEMIVKMMGADEMTK